MMDSSEIKVIYGIAVNEINMINFEFLHTIGQVRHANFKLTIYIYMSIVYRYCYTILSFT